MSLNKITFLVLAFIASLAPLSAQNDLIDITEVELPNGDIDFYATTKAFCPVTLNFTFDRLDNMKPDQKLPIKKAIHPGEEKQFLVKLVRSKRADAFFSYQISFRLGDAINATHNDNQVYLLPYESGTTQLIGQGFNGRFSHKGINALDFNLKKGTKICAARGGIVALIKEDSNSGCKNKRCQSLSNYIIIYHEDGSFGHYGHLKKDGVLVEEGQKVEAGEVIGLSGNTGWSSGPHLHFEVYFPSGDMRQTVPVRFLLKDKSKVILKEGKSYTAYHPKTSAKD
ncbi:MAG: M23 family metallopeptidase [Bacteroidota bacterium]